MELELNSWHARLYKEIYEDKPPSNLCPYFWKLVLIFAFLPITLILFIPKKIIGKRWKGRDSIFSSSNIVYSFLFYLILFLISCIVAYISGNRTQVAVKGTVGTILIVALISLFYIGFRIDEYYTDKMIKKFMEMNDEDWENWRKGKKNKKNIIIEFIKAKYNNYCPKITWK
jgi:hypothetical protein